jgi:hypothetical protein
MLKSSYEVEIMINGKPAKEYYHEGEVYIEGRKDTRFSIKIKNNSYSRKLFVPTIDGLSVMNGEEGSYESSGYIVQGYSSITIDGWRTSDKDVASFYFSSPEGSYRKKMDKGNNLGVIGVAVFDEVYHFPTYQTFTNTIPYPYNTITSPYMGIDWGTTTPLTNGTANIKAFQSSGGSNLSASATNDSMQVMNCNYRAGSSPKQQLGTGFGEQRTSEVTTVNFERKNYPETTFEIRYNTREELEKTGIIFKKEPLYVAPQAFPGNYCKPPKN